MKQFDEKSQERLEKVPRKNRVYLFNADIIIDFLNQTLMPIHYFVKPETISKLKPGVPLAKFFMKNENDLEEHRLTIGDLYEYYLLFRQQKDYTTPVETRYKFSVILRKLSFSQNGWQFLLKRYTRAQFIYVSPVQLRVRVPIEIRKNYPPGELIVGKGQIDIEPEDLSDDAIEDVDSIDIEEIQREEAKPKNFVEVPDEFGKDYSISIGVDVAGEEEDETVEREIGYGPLNYAKEENFVEVMEKEEEEEKEEIQGEGY